MARPSPFDTRQPLIREVAVYPTKHAQAHVTEEQVTTAVDPVTKIARLVCDCSEYQRALKFPWCPHVEEVITKELDGKSEEDFTVKHDLPPVVEVPIFAKKPHLSVPVVLARGPMDDARAVTVAGEHVGYIFVGQGRRSLRTLIIDWLVEKSIDLPDCRAAHHYAPLPWQLVALPGHATRPAGEHFIEFNPRRKDHLANLADLLLTGQCRRCNEDNGVPDV